MLRPIHFDSFDIFCYCLICFLCPSCFSFVIVPFSLCWYNHLPPSTLYAARGNQALEEEILGHSKSLYQAMSLGQALRTVSSVDEKELVQAKLDITQRSYIELQECCHRKAELLQKALANARLFGEDEVALMNWLDEVHSKLCDLSIQDYTPAVLEKQHAEQLVEQSSSSSGFSLQFILICIYILLAFSLSFYCICLVFFFMAILSF